jgi:hypothetical protein
MVAPLCLDEKREEMNGRKDETQQRTEVILHPTNVQWKEFTTKTHKKSLERPCELPLVASDTDTLHVVTMGKALETLS